MNTAAANALLKTLEEPGGELMLILTTSRRDALLPTIRSRCQQFRFDPITEDDLREALQRDPDVPRDNIDLAVHLANGSYAEAVQIASSEGLVSREGIVEFMRAVVSANPQKIMEQIQDRTASNDRQAVVRFLNAIASWFRDILALQAGADAYLRNVDLATPLTRFHEHYPDVRCAEAVEIIEDVIELVQKNVHLVNVLIVLSQRLRRCIVPAERMGV
jgi:DNA polymerase-3 subunit delta'